jgi:uncharacterized protein GlcG (DUF336 family)
VVTANQEADSQAMADSISLSSAEKAIEAGKAKAAELGIAFTISVLDRGARLADSRTRAR